MREMRFFLSIATVNKHVHVDLHQGCLGMFLDAATFAPISGLSLVPLFRDRNAPNVNTFTRSRAFLVSQECSLLVAWNVHIFPVGESHAREHTRANLVHSTTLMGVFTVSNAQLRNNFH